MIKIIDKRGTGKTGRLFLLAKETGATVVCSNPNAFRQKSYNYGMTGINFISYYDFLNNSKGTNEKYLVDELENLLSTINDNIIGYSLSED